MVVDCNLVVIVEEIDGDFGRSSISNDTSICWFTYSPKNSDNDLDAVLKMQLANVGYGGGGIVDTRIEEGEDRLGKNAGDIRIFCFIF